MIEYFSVKTALVTRPDTHWRKRSSQCNDGQKQVIVDINHEYRNYPENNVDNQASENDILPAEPKKYIHHVISSESYEMTRDPGKLRLS